MLPGIPDNLSLTFLKSQRRFLPQPYKSSHNVREIRFELTGDGNFISVRVDGHRLRCKIISDGDDSAAATCSCSDGTMGKSRGLRI